MHRKLVLVAALCLLLGAVLALSQGADHRPAHAQGPDGLPLPTDRTDLFAGSGLCVGCHTQMIDETGTDVSVDAAWRSTMMANAARDPYWQATVRLESDTNPHLADILQDKCATCHMPLARTSAHQAGEPTRILGDGFLSEDHALHSLAMDGNSCTLCHQIEADNLGQADSFSGGYLIDPSYPEGERPTFSRFEVSAANQAVMQAASGYVPVQADHTGQAELCATCHTLWTPYVDENGEVAGEFPEQMPYLEWKHGFFSRVQPCQGCHMPRAMGGVITSITGGEVRNPFFTHYFVGGNAYLQQIFMEHGDDLGVTASRDHFHATHEQVMWQLQNRTALLDIENTAIVDARLEAHVVVQPLAGHKFPAGFPSRRAFIHFWVTDADGAVIFESGAYEPDGYVHGDDHDDDPLRYEPHYTAITSPDQVQIYEAVMADTQGRSTTILLRGAGYLKNNRLLPSGFDKESAPDPIAVRGIARHDLDFVGGSDTVLYMVDVGDAEGPFTVHAELLFLSISYHWAERLRDQDTVEAKRFLALYDDVPNTPVLITSASTTVDTSAATD